MPTVQMKRVAGSNSSMAATSLEEGMQGPDILFVIVVLLLFVHDL